MAEGLFSRLSLALSAKCLGASLFKAGAARDAGIAHQIGKEGEKGMNFSSFEAFEGRGFKKEGKEMAMAAMEAAL